jgi:hypothetical protein
VSLHFGSAGADPPTSPGDDNVSDYPADEPSSFEDYPATPPVPAPPYDDAHCDAGALEDISPAVTQVKMHPNDLLRIVPLFTLFT